MSAMAGWRKLMMLLTSALMRLMILPRSMDCWDLQEQSLL